MTEVLRSPSGRILVPLEHDLITTFAVTRGSFTIPADVLEAAELGDDYELRRAFARGLPDQDGAVLNTSRQVHRDGSATVTWRRVVIHTRRA